MNKIGFVILLGIVLLAAFLVMLPAPRTATGTVREDGRRAAMPVLEYYDIEVIQEADGAVWVCGVWHSPLGSDSVCVKGGE